MHPNESDFSFVIRAGFSVLVNKVAQRDKTMHLRLPMVGSLDTYVMVHVEVLGAVSARAA